MKRVTTCQRPAVERPSAHDSRYLKTEIDGRGRGRAGEALTDGWADEDAHAHLSVTLPGFLNLFLLSGPNTALGHGRSQITIIDRPRHRGSRGPPRSRRRRRGPNRTIWAHRGMANAYRKEEQQHRRLSRQTVDKRYQKLSYACLIAGESYTYIPSNSMP